MPLSSIQRHWPWHSLGPFVREGSGGSASTWEENTSWCYIGSWLLPCKVAQGSSLNFLKCQFNEITNGHHLLTGMRFSDVEMTPSCTLLCWAKLEMSWMLWNSAWRVWESGWGGTSLVFNMKHFVHQQRTVVPKQQQLLLSFSPKESVCDLWIFLDLWLLFKQ